MAALVTQENDRCSTGAKAITSGKLATSPTILEDMESRMPSYSIKIRKSQVLINFSDFDPEKCERIVMEKLEDFLPMIVEGISSQLVWERLSEQQRSSRIVGYLATDMKVQAMVAFTESQIKQHAMSVRGELTPSELGFPELDHDDD